MEVLRSVRAGRPRPRAAPGPGAAAPVLSWIGDERIAISGVPSARALAGLAGQGVTHVVNCRPRAQARWRGDLAAERAAFGPGRVAHAPMRDHGLLGQACHRPGRRHAADRDALIPDPAQRRTGGTRPGRLARSRPACAYAPQHLHASPPVSP